VTVRRDRAVIGALIAAELVIGAWYATKGSGYVLDDWFAAGRGRMHGWTQTTLPPFGRRRPGAAAVYTIQFGLLGGHPLLGQLVLTGLGAIIAVLFFLVLRRHLPTAWAAGGAALWVLLPNHTALEFWQSCVHIDVAVPLALGAILLVDGKPGSRGRAGLSIALLMAATLTYEAVLPAAALAMVAVPILEARRPRFLHAAAVAAAGAACVAWQLANPDPSKALDRGVAPLQDALPGEFGWGILRSGPVARLLLLLVLVAGVAAIARLVLPSFRPDDRRPEVLIALGLTITFLGALPFALYFYAPLGAGDRFNLASAFGGALVWIGMGMWARRAPWLPLGAAVLLVLLALPARIDRQSTWTTAAGDGKRVVQAIVDRYPTDPGAAIVLGPAPVQRTNITAFLDQSNVSGMLRFTYGVEVPGGIAYSREDFESVPPEQRFDLWALSRLEADVDLSVDHQGVPVTPPP
jgi:hypothetical protein